MQGGQKLKSYRIRWTYVSYIHIYIYIHTHTHTHTNMYMYIAHLRQDCHNSKFVIFQEKRLKALNCYNFLWVQRRHNCSPAASFASCVMTLYLLKLLLQTFLSIPSSSPYSWRIRRVSCSLILKMKLVPPSRLRSSYVPSSFWSVF